MYYIALMYECTTTYSSIFLLMDISVVSNFYFHRKHYFVHSYKFSQPITFIEPLSIFYCLIKTEKSHDLQTIKIDITCDLLRALRFKLQLTHFLCEAALLTSCHFWTYLLKYFRILSL